MIPTKISPIASGGLQLTAEGSSNSEIAERLCISPRTVEVHRANLMEKLDLHSQMDILRYAVRRGNDLPGI